MVNASLFIQNFIKDNPNSNLSDLNYVVAEYFSISYDELSDTFISPRDQKKLHRLFLKVTNYYPPQYLFNKAYFYKRVFYINKHTLIPRFDSEPMIEQILSLNTQHKKILEIGTGSGALIITLALENKNNYYEAVDISRSALSVCKRNINNHQVSINLYQSDLFLKVKNKFDLIIANLPYLTNDEIVGNLTYEPRLALFGKDKDGLGIIKRLLDSLYNYLNDDGLCYLECNPPQINLIKKYILTNNLNLTVVTVQQDLHQLDRYIILRRNTINAT